LANPTRQPPCLARTLPLIRLVILVDLDEALLEFGFGGNCMWMCADMRVYARNCAVLWWKLQFKLKDTNLCFKFEMQFLT
jgi:hypothetical protein